MGAKTNTVEAGSKCSNCGAMATQSLNWERSCNCGAPYVKPRQRALPAITASPHKSNRMIAKETGVSHETVRKARQATANKLAVEEPRLGLDNKTRRLPQRQKPRLESNGKNGNGCDLAERMRLREQALSLIAAMAEADRNEFFALLHKIYPTSKPGK